jgi:hypothetical protein
MFTEHLVHTATVLRRGVGSDRFGQAREPGTVVGTHRCRLTVARGGERYTERSREVVAATHKLFLEVGADITEADSVTVVDELDRPLITNAEVTLVTRPRNWAGEHHVEVELSATRSPGAAR